MDQSTISNKNYGKNCYLDNLILKHSSTLITMLRNNEQKLRQGMLWVRKIVQGERGNFKHFLKFPYYFVTECSFFALLNTVGLLI